MSKVNVGIQGISNFLMSSKFFSVITRNCVNRIGRQQMDHFFFYSFLCPFFHQSHSKKPAFPIYQCDNSPFFSFADDRVCLPITNSFSVLSYLWPFFYADFIGYFASLVAISSVFSVFFRVAKVFDNSPPCCLSSLTR